MQVCRIIWRNKCKSISLMYGKCRTELFQLRAYKLLEIVSLVDEIDIIIWQCLVDEIFECEILKSRSVPTTDDPDDPERELTAVEKNAIYYAGGFIIRKVSKVYANNHLFKECLEGLMDSDYSAVSECASQWQRTTDRGGLFKLSDLGLQLFCSIERNSYKFLKNNFSRKSKASTEDICESSIEDPDTQYIWSVISMDVMVGRDELLRRIITEWVVMRGHSLRGKYMDDYRKEQREKKALRKSLKRADAERKEKERSETDKQKKTL